MKNLDSFLSLFVSIEVDETEATALTALVAGLELLDHETRNGAQGDLGRDRVEASKDLLELYGGLAIELESTGESYGITNLVLGQVVRQVSHHDLGLGGDTILGGTALLLLDTATRLALLLGGTGVVGLVSDLVQRLSLTRGIGGSLSLIIG